MITVSLDKSQKLFGELDPVRQIGILQRRKIGDGKLYLISCRLI